MPLCAALLAWLVPAPAPAAAAPQLSWSGAIAIDPQVALNGVACASQTLCVAVDESGEALVSTDPVAGSVGSWSAHPIDGRTLTAVSCAPSSTLCVAVDGEGRVLVSDNAGSEWSQPLDVDGTNALSGVSCASTALCVAVDRSGNAIVSGAPGVPAASSWSVHAIDGGHVLTGVSCASGLPCAAVDKEGRGLVSSDPGEGAWAQIRALHAAAGAGLTAVSCTGELAPAPEPAGLCVAGDEAGEALASGAPAAGVNASWEATPLEIGPLTAVSCQAAGLCVAVDGSGGVYGGDGPATATPSWTARGSLDAPHELTGVSCVAEGLCVAVDNDGHAFLVRVPAPVVATTPPNALSVAETAASLSGTVDTNDATLSGCRFEYGPSEAYGQSVPCSALGVGSANQPVGAFLTGLTPNVTYDYRLVAVSASGEGTANATFKTPAPPLVQPHPSISGIPAPGQRLTCKSGVSGAGASSATLTYAWLRNTKAIAGAGGSTYVVGSADVSRHLQCRVTATNAGGSASATSGFVNVPAGGLGSISETRVGAPRVAGRTVSVPVTCSTQAYGSCTITLRLTVLETLRGRRVVAVAARAGELAAGSASRGAAHRAVTVGTARARVPAGKGSTVTVALNATGRSLLAGRRHLAAKLSVRGTVVGVLSAQLRSATVTFGGARKASFRG